MLRFAVFDDFGPANAWELRRAYLIGKDNLAVPSQIKFQDGIIECRKASPDAAALSLQYNTKDWGLLTLRTTLLPDREQPVLLDLELARHRIMLVLDKLEEWGLASLLEPDDPIMIELNAARDLFTDALVEPSAPFGHFAPRMAQLASDALSRAIAASEHLAQRQAERQFEQRYTIAQTVEEKSRSQYLPQFGCAVHNERFAPPLQKVIQSTFQFIVSPMRWNDIEENEGSYSFQATDRWIEWAVRDARLPVVSGPLLDLSSRSVPEWLTIWQHDYETLREFAYEHVSRVVKRYRKAVTRWTAISAPTVADGVQLSLDQWVDLTRLAVVAIRKGAANTRAVVEIPAPFGEHPGGDETMVPPTFFAEMLLHAGVEVDAFGLRIQMGDHVPGRSCRDLMQVSAIIDEFSRFERPLHITAIGAPSEPQGDRSEHNSPEPGYWKAPWSGEQQAEWMLNAVTIAASKPFVRTVAWQALYDTERCSPEMNDGGLITRDGRAKPALRCASDIRQSIRKGIAPTVYASEAASTA
ncbi:MAG: endo-1,4-beta-xylanase [Phycisphaerales bacterium]